MALPLRLWAGRPLFAGLVIGGVLCCAFQFWKWFCMDRISKEVRSRVMASIRGKDTKPEMALRLALHSLGFRYRVHVGGLPGSPDIVLSRYKAVIFVNGCFWHLHGCGYARVPKERVVFWESKFRRNKARDASNVEALLAAGWRVLIVWECAFGKKGSRERDSLLSETADWIRSSEKYREIPHFPPE